MSARVMVPGPLLLFGGFVFAASLALVTAWGLAGLARPAELDARLHAVDVMQQRTAKLLAGRSGRSVYSPQAVCPSTSAADLGALRERLGAVAAASGLGHVRIEATADEAAFDDPLSPIQFKLEASGSYAGAIGLLNVLQRGPVLAYADAVDLYAEDAATVRIALKGRFYCWTAASS
ncbi:hypothetical protein DMC25_00945 [Caulobacter sp. D4A]|uniref:hypothetical protein n=1 Tax=unclassified Caulobacter TaxID=2648921 RepID=UPI000D73D1AA|nr:MULTISPECIES: hypothetical protein [unclassified Caulobacter]PXA95304.1 hypothetical protein DMC25_00945 [Caulobacter sp. D4A]PXA95615.1 hypothetical protein DMC18_03585 [Caulobacter sp. D5]